MAIGFLPIPIHRDPFTHPPFTKPINNEQQAINNEQINYEPINNKQNQSNLPFYAKQTQLSDHPNKRKYGYNKVLCKFTTSQILQKQTQKKPIKSQLKANLNPASLPGKTLFVHLTDEGLQHILKQNKERVKR